MDPTATDAPMLSMASSTMPLLAYLVIVMAIYAVAGWLWETVYCSLVERRFVRRGVLYGPACPLYGFAVLFLYYPLMGVDNPAVVFVLGALLATALEYGTAVLLEVTLRRSFWSYDNMPLNLHGRICLPASLMFGVFALVIRYAIQPVIEPMLEGIPTDRLCDMGLVTFVAFLVDIVMSAKRWEFDTSRIPASIATVTQRIPEYVITPHDIGEILSDAIQALRDDIGDRRVALLGEHSRMPSVRILSARLIGRGRLLITARIGERRSVLWFVRERLDAVAGRFPSSNDDKEIIRRAVARDDEEGDE